MQFDVALADAAVGEEQYGIPIIWPAAAPAAEVATPSVSPCGHERRCKQARRPCQIAFEVPLAERPVKE